MIRRLYRLWPEPALLARLWSLTAAQAVLQGGLLGLLVPILDAVVRPRPDLDAAAPWLVLGLLGALVYAVISIIATPVGFRAAGELAVGLRSQLMRHITAVPLGWFTADHKARLARAVTSDVGDAAHLAVTIAGPVVTSVLLPATIVAVVAFVDWRMALALCVIAVVAAVALRRAAHISELTEVELERASAGVAGRAIELGQAQPVLRAAGHPTGTPHMHTALLDHRNTYRSGMRRARRPYFAYTAVIAAGFVAVLALTARLVVTGEVGTATAVALLVLSARFLEPLGNLIELIGALRAMTNKVARIEAMLLIPALPTPDHAVDRIDSAEIEFDSVTFAYPGADDAALRDVSLRCAPGTTTALVGASGSGKTTITRLVARFFDVDDGEIRIGGIDVRSIDPETLMGDIAIIFQEVYLFDDTIENNLRIARPEAGWRELEEAARAARVDELIERLPNGWRTRVGEGGTALSGGERQRVAIARAILKEARIVLVDEASSALDPQNEAAVTDAIAELGADPERTTIVIAHRPATLRSADRVIALADGRVAEAGMPADLIAADGVFARLIGQADDARRWRITDRTGGRS
ncbi:ABC transporter ATP-binding protein [Gordonia soli]|uniref:Putative iron-siderophore ABC transporter permease/ATP-binding protein n=1 Tax=Gordonia soli NBRC 108243 TaxID=1223545 RepID=M0QED0_9ACTN|nr:ABC transporter ATP-binding protein [Gordonia soli]GAC66925.1 putative iron-siderophore ABC transporter permease/ATP-binding protein [Gordonia soli NBRC 108243]